MLFMLVKFSRKKNNKIVLITSSTVLLTPGVVVTVAQIKAIYDILCKKYFAISFILS